MATQRFGMTVSSVGEGRSRLIPAIPDGAPITPTTRELQAIRARAMPTAKRLDEQNRELLAWKKDAAAGKAREAAVQPLPTRRQLLARDKAAIEQLSAKLNALDVDAFDRRQGLQPFQYKSDLSSVLQRQELRSVLRGMKAQERAAALKLPQFAAAAYEVVGPASGMSQPEHDAFRNATLRQRFPDELATLDAEDQALAMTKTTLATIAEALDEEGEAVDPPQTPADARKGEAKPQQEWA